MNAFCIGSASAFGAIIGGLTALSLLPHWLWFLGVLFGGLVGYLSYGWKDVFAGVTHAYRTTVAWQPNKPFWKFFGMSMLWLHLVGVHVGVAFYCMYVLGQVDLVLKDNFIGLLTSLSLLSPLTATMIATEATNFADPPRYFSRNDQELYLADRYTQAFLRLFPLSSKYWLYALVLNLPAVFRFVGQFFYQVIVFIHSDARTMCFLGGSIGATAGFFSGSWLIGGVIGALVGLVSYEFVGKRLLHITAK